MGNLQNGPQNPRSLNRFKVLTWCTGTECGLRPMCGQLGALFYTGNAGVLRGQTRLNGIYICMVEKEEYRVNEAFY